MDYPEYYAKNYDTRIPNDLYETPNAAEHSFSIYRTNMLPQQQP